ncbi:MAG: DUF4062 domain-containing protein [Methanobrevibacter sp.]|nr:DUF4062 domain-containing protein [Methanobrevibacter sp.]
MEWKTATIFISSTFNDMHAERDYLIKEVFPEFREWCEERNIRMNEIDLRWGVSAEDSQQKNTIKKCLEHIDKSRPFFLCFLGQRRGWIPDFSKDISESTTDLYGDIGNYDGKSATEMEILHSILEPLDKTIVDENEIKPLTERDVEETLLYPLYKIMEDENKLRYCPTRYSLFYFRDDSYLEDIEKQGAEEYEYKRLIYTNDSEDKNDDLPDYGSQDADLALKEFKQKIIDKKLAVDEDPDKRINMLITGYSGRWNEDLVLPELKPVTDSKGEKKYTHNEMQGRLTNFVGDSDALDEFSNYDYAECDGIPLKNIILHQLKAQFEIEFEEHLKDFKSHDELSDEEKDLNQQEIFTYVNSEGYIKREEYDDALANYVNGDDNRIFLLSAKAGLGKTMLLANFAKNFNENFSGIKLYKRFCGASDLSSQTLSLWKSLLYEAEIGEDAVFYPNNTDELKRNMGDILNAIASKGPSLIVLDAINQIPNGIDMLKWIKELPENLKMVISIKEDEGDKEFNQKLIDIKKKDELFNNVELKELEEEKIVGLIENYLENYLKELSADQIEVIKNSDGSNNPLYLKILLAELRVFGSFEQLKDEISKFGDNPQTAFDHVLDRLEDDEKTLPGDNIVPLIFSYLANARVGLSEEELVSLIDAEDEIGLDREDIRGAVNVTLRQVRPFMAIKEKRHDFFYESFKLASEERYKENKIELNEKLANYFKGQIIDDDSSSNLLFKDYSDCDAATKTLKSRDYNELPYHLAESNDLEGLKEVLSSYSFIKNKIDLSNVYNLILDYDYVDWNKVDNPDFEEENEDHPMVLIQRAVELSAPVLNNDKTQVASQLWGRMNGLEYPEIESLLSGIEGYTDEVWLKSLGSALYSPKSAIIKRIKPDGKYNSQLALSSNKRIVIASDNRDLKADDYASSSIGFKSMLSLYNLEDNYLELIDESDSEYVVVDFLDEEKESHLITATSKGIIKEWDLNNKTILKEYPDESINGDVINEYYNAKITDIYYSNTYQKIFASSHNGIFSINLESGELKKEAIEPKDYDHIFVPRRNEAILVCDEKEVDGWDVYEMRKAYNQHHQHEESAEEREDSSSDFARRMISSGNIKFMGLIKRFLILISENGQMKMWNTLKNSGSGEGIDEAFISSLNDIFAQAICIENENKVISISKMGLLRLWDIPQPRSPNFTIEKEVQTGISSPTALSYYNKDGETWVIVGNESNDISLIDLNKVESLLDSSSEEESPEEETSIDKEEENKSILDKKHTESVLTIKTFDDNIITASHDGEVFIWNLNEDSDSLSVDLVKDFANEFRNNCISYDKNSRNLVCSGQKMEEDKIKDLYAYWTLDDINNPSITDEGTKSSFVIDVVQNGSDVSYIEEDGDKSNLIIGDNSISLDYKGSALASVYGTDDLYIGFENGEIAKYDSSINYLGAKQDSKVEKIKVYDDNLIVGYANGIIDVLDTNGNGKVSLGEHSDEIIDLEFYGADKLISVSKDNTLKIWDLTKEDSIYTYYLDIFASSVAVSDDKIIVGDALGNIRLFNVLNI